MKNVIKQFSGSLLLALSVALIAACQQNPFPDTGMLRREPLTKPKVDRQGWSHYAIRCIEHLSSTSQALKIESTDPFTAQLEVEIFPAAARKFVTWNKGTLEILSDAADVTGYHRFHVEATATHAHIPSSTAEEMFVYYVTDKACPAEYVTDDAIRTGKI